MSRRLVHPNDLTYIGAYTDRSTGETTVTFQDTVNDSAIYTRKLKYNPASRAYICYMSRKVFIFDMYKGGQFEIDHRF